jgi:hypothetical protein
MAARFEYIFETDEQDVPKTATKEKVIQYGNRQRIVSGCQ